MYTTIKDHKTFRTLSEGWSMERVTQLIDKDAEQVRPYVGEYTWAVFTSYQAVMLRIVFLLNLGRDDAAKLEWHKDGGTRQLIQAVLTAGELASRDVALCEQTRVKLLRRARGRSSSFRRTAAIRASTRCRAACT
ncbi:MAG: hypothetical protein A3G21_20700 [Acidobacteria bacterium RIFCSPLOWO2_12_FULL_66_21]|nr:MAG: hypothetical protein A3G21_20700 [Acidobacteria bacterium RIFCSPLOWO2_12_FULL_66_21]